MTNNSLFATSIVVVATATVAVAIVIDEEWDKWRNHGQVVESMAYVVVR